MTAAALSLLLTSNFTYAADIATSGLNDKVEWTENLKWPVPANTIDFVHSLDGKYAYFLTSDHQVTIYTADGVKQGAIPVAEGVTAIDIAPQGEMLYLVDSKENTLKSLAIDFVVNVPTEGSAFMGPVDAPVTIVIFTDFECPYCKKTAPLIQQVFSANTSDTKVVFKNMPLDFHKFAEPAARAGIAANIQGKFWEFHDAIFATETLDDGTIEKIAKSLNLDMDKFKADMESAATKAKVQQDIIEAKNAGVTGTPTVFINGRRVKQRSPEAFQVMIDAELKKAGKL